MNALELLKLRLMAIIAMVMAVDSSLEDRKITFGEWISIATKAIGLYKVVRDFKDIISAYETLTDEESAELADYFTQEFDLRNDVVENYIERIIGILLQIKSLIGFGFFARKSNLKEIKA